MRSAALRAAALPRIQETLSLTKDELHAGMLRLTEPRSECFAAEEDSDNVQYRFLRIKSLSQWVHPHAVAKLS